MLRKLHSPIIVALTCSCFGLVACSSDDTPNPVNLNNSDASSDSNPADSSSDASTADSTATDSTADSTADATDAGPHRYALFAGSNYKDLAEIVAIDLDSPSTGSFTSKDQDTLVSASSGFAFALQRTLGLVTILDPANASLEKSTLDVSPQGDAGKANPYAALVSAGDKAYVVRYGQNSLTIIDPTAGVIKGSVDLSAYVADPDGLIDVFDGVVDPISKRAYFGLQRINQTVFGEAPDYAPPCLDTKALIIAVDITTDKVLDLNGSAAGEGLEIASKNPSAIVWDDTNKRIILLGAGCASSKDKRQGRGLEAVDPTTGTSSWLWESDSLDRPATLIWTGVSGIVGVDDASFSRHWYPWTSGASSLGTEITEVPTMPISDGKGGLIGLEDVKTDGGSSTQLVRLDLTSKAKEILRTNVFQAQGLTATSSALLH